MTLEHQAVREAKLPYLQVLEIGFYCISSLRVPGQGWLHGAQRLRSPDYPSVALGLDLNVTCSLRLNPTQIGKNGEGHVGIVPAVRVSVLGSTMWK